MNLKDRRFGRLVVEGNASRKGYVICLCDCGKRKEIRATSLTKAFQPTRSCGCIHRERVRTIGSKTIPQNMAKQVEINMQYHTNFQVIGTQTPPKNNTSGHKGISWDADRKMWIAYINVPTNEYSSAGTPNWMPPWMLEREQRRNTTRL